MDKCVEPDELDDDSLNVMHFVSRKEEKMKALVDNSCRRSIQQIDFITLRELWPISAKKNSLNERRALKISSPEQTDWTAFTKHSSSFNKHFTLQTKLAHLHNAFYTIHLALFPIIYSHTVTLGLVLRFSILQNDTWACRHSFRKKNVNNGFIN